MSKMLHHVTLTTGHVRRSPRDEVSDETVAELWPLVVDLITGEGVAPRTRKVPGFPKYQIQCLTYHGPPLFRVYGPIPDKVPKGGLDLPCLVTFGVVVEPGDGAEGLWRNVWVLGHLDELHGEPPDLPDELPWCAVALDAGLAKDHDAAKWLGDFERSIAWTLWSIRHEPRH